MGTYRLPLDDKMDKDIIEWLDGISNGRKAEIVRQALRTYIQESNAANSYYINRFQSGTIDTSSTTEVTNTIQQPKQDEPEQLKKRKRPKLNF
ncbi:hypothetical protein [Geomicrobium sp. JCM 19055]|uniref:hypothetical protein n=1 Tax=Geomicrobium sp. JCM 19055 TaxID=1460649 RepID=UPI00045EDCD9|nr:hypothetical protein [Geomicrobium sp. JCM 19055]GAJ99847.1 hypothetical protein JCM19055_2903 [Geomicrobium sp. JCM 19055]